MGEPNGDHGPADVHCTGIPTDPTPARPDAIRLTHDHARALKQLAPMMFGYPEGERRLRADLGFEPDERLTFRHLAAHVSPEVYATLMDGYTAILRQAVEADGPHFDPPNGEGAS